MPSQSLDMLYKPNSALPAACPSFFDTNMCSHLRAQETALPRLHSALPDTFPFKTMPLPSLLNCGTQKEIGHSDLHKLLGSDTEKETNNLVLMKEVFAEWERSAVTISQMKQLVMEKYLL